MDTIVNKGYIKMYTSMAMRGSVPNLIVEFQLSSCKLDDREKNLINKVSSEKDFKRILQSEVEDHFKIAKILCNQLDWRIIFDSNRDLKYSVQIPLNQLPANEEDLVLQGGEEDCQDINEEDDSRHTPGIMPERTIASQQSNRNNKTYLQTEHNQRQSRPLTVDESFGRKNRQYFESVPEEPEGVEDIEDYGMNALVTSPKSPKPLHLET